MINREYFERVIALAQTEEERQKLIDFINDINNEEFLEYTYLLSNECYGFQTLSSGKTVYISPPPATPEEMGNAFKVLAKRMKEKEKDTEFWDTLTDNFIEDKHKQISEAWEKLNNIKPNEPTIEQLKKQIKYSKNPLEVKMLNKKLNQIYKDIKRR